MKIFDPEYKEDTIRLFIENFLWGKVSVDYMKFGSKQKGLKFAKELNRKIQHWQGHMLVCGDEDPAEFARVQDWIFDAIHEARAYGALVGELHDKTYEDRIRQLEDENARKTKEIADLTALRDQLVAQLAQISTTEPPMKKGFNALG